jgi:hypothetical protein
VNTRAPEQDYAYELTLEELRRSMALTEFERLHWLDEARRFTIAARDAPTIRYRAGEPEPDWNAEER